MPFVELDQIRQAEIIPGFHGRFIHSEQMTLAQWRIEANAAAPEHAHPHEQICIVLEGRLELSLGSQRNVMEAGSVAVIPSTVPHSARALTACKVIDMFHPAREDYR